LTPGPIKFSSRIVTLWLSETYRYAIGDRKYEIVSGLSHTALLLTLCDLKKPFQLLLFFVHI